MSRPPNVRPDRTPDHLKWSREAVECGKSLKGWIAGPVFGCEGHPTPAFKPCHALFTRGARTCPWCAIPKLAAIRYQGYLPLYSDQLKRIVVCVNLDTTVQCDALTLLTPITVRKGKHKTSPLTVEVGWTTLTPSGRSVRTTPQDVVPWLVSVLWKAEGLQEYANHQPHQASPLASPPSTGMTPSPERAVEALEQRGKLPSLSAMLKMRQQIDPDALTPAQSSNGHGAKKPKPK